MPDVADHAIRMDAINRAIRPHGLGVLGTVQRELLAPLQQDVEVVVVVVVEATGGSRARAPHPEAYVGRNQARDDPRPQRKVPPLVELPDGRGKQLPILSVLGRHVQLATSHVLDKVSKPHRLRLPFAEALLQRRTLLHLDIRIPCVPPEVRGVPSLRRSPPFLLERSSDPHRPPLGDEVCIERIGRQLLGIHNRKKVTFILG
mmetsp:Transcript_7718/g.22025  ORF Transcript_7718/g.22025 Transcript_7718/m.22025 type:complete len:203 (-) Transcript_7718:80-688(-)